MTVSPAGDGYWYTRANGEREWREAPRCDCGGTVDLRLIKDIDTAEDNEAIGEVVCAVCGKVHATFLKPSLEAIGLGRELAERYRG